MKWKNVLKDSLPEHNQEVLISVDGIYYLTRYDSETNGFRLRDEPSTFFEIEENQLIYWLGIADPPMIRDEY